MIAINPLHFVMAIPVTYADHLNACGAALGYGPTNFSKPLVTPPAMETVTHYGMDTHGAESFKLLAEAAQQGTLPDDIDWSSYGVTLEQATAAFAAMLMSVKDRGEMHPKDHFAEFLTANGLAALEAEAP